MNTGAAPKIVFDGQWHTFDFSNPTRGYDGVAVPINAKTLILRIDATSYVAGAEFKVRRYGDENGIQEYRMVAYTGGAYIAGKEVWVNIEGTNAKVDLFFSGGGVFLSAGVLARAWIIEE
jgi:hypothetical protein